MESYKRYIANKELKAVHKMIDHLPQPTMFGGGSKPRRFVQTSSTDYDYPSSLAVGNITGRPEYTLADNFFDGRYPLGADPRTWTPPHLQGGDAFGDFFKDTFGHLGDEYGPVNPVKLGYDIGYNHLGPAIFGKGRKGRKKGGDFWGDFGNGFKRGFTGVMNPVMDIAAPVLKDAAKDAIVGAIRGKGRKPRNSVKGGDFWGDFGNGFKRGFTGVMNPVMDIAAPVLKDAAKDAIVGAIRGKGRKPRNSVKRGGFGWGDISRGFQEVGKTLAPGLKDIGNELAPIARDVAKDAIVGAIKGKGRKSVKKGGFGWGDIVSGFHAVDNITRPIAKELLPIAVKGALGAGRKRSPSARNQIVKQVMREKGLSLPQASKYVKDYGLYKK